MGIPSRVHLRQQNLPLLKKIIPSQRDNDKRSEALFPLSSLPSHLWNRHQENALTLFPSLPDTALLQTLPHLRMDELLPLFSPPLAPRLESLCFAHSPPNLPGTETRSSPLLFPPLGTAMSFLHLPQPHICTKGSCFPLLLFLPPALRTWCTAASPPSK